MTNLKNLKREIRELRKLKLKCRAGTKERLFLHRKLIELKKQLKELKTTTVTSSDAKLDFKPKTIVKEEVTQTEKYKDDNGCSYFGYCKKINVESLINHTCYNTKYILDKLEGKCSQLIKN
jgi:hypothetical protein